MVEAKDATGYWSVPAWDERGYGDLDEDFATRAAALEAIASCGFTVVTSPALQ